MTSLRLNTTPYYDDHAPNKNFHKILFKPGFAVQARELTQLQTVLQEQISRFGDHVFKEGSVIAGCPESHNFEISYVKILDTDADAAAVDNDTLEDYEGEIIVGRTSGVRAKIKKVATGTESDIPNFKTFFVQYLNGGTSNVATQFDYEEILELESDTDVTFEVATEASTALGKGSIISVGDGVVYANGTFILHNSQTVILERYSTEPTKRVGFVVVETVVDSTEDATLLDPARGSNNYTAPGADRYKLTTELVAIEDDEEKPVGFYLLFEVEEGRIKRRYDKAQYAELRKELARRTYDESGDYTIRPFGLVVREHLKTSTNNGRYLEADGGDASKLVVGVEPGKAYVRGFEHELFATEYVPVDKGIDEEELGNAPVSTSYGNYVLADDVLGPIALNAGTLVSLRDVGDTVIGTARYRSIEYSSGAIGTAGAIYRIYLSDITMTAGSFSEVVGIFDGSDKLATVDADEGLKSTRYAPMIFPLSSKNTKETADHSFVYKKQFTAVAVDTDTAFSISLSGSETWAFTSVPDLTVDTDIIVIAETAFTGGTLGEIPAGTILDVAGLVSYGSSTSLLFDLDETTTGTPTVSVIVNVRKTGATPNNKTLRKNRAVKIDTQTNVGSTEGPWSLGFSDAFKVDKVWIAANTEAYPAIDIASADPDDSIWTEVTDEFNLLNGQTDSSYDIAKLQKKVNSTLNTTSKKLIVKVSYFEHAGSSGFYTVDSYPLPAISVAPAADEIEWYEIPLYTSVGGTAFNLRDSVDFRSTVTRVSADVTAVASATENPAIYTESGKLFTTAIVTPVATEEMTLDVTHLLGRIDRIVLDVDGNFVSVRGNASNAPVRPRQPDNAMTIGFVNIPPFPSLSPFVAAQIGRLDLSTSISTVDNRRFTMRDIGDIHRRISRLEYYTSLSLLEQNTANLLIPGDSGEDRFKNGMLVDAFDGHNIGNVFDPAYKCSIANNQLRPAFKLENIEFALDDSSTNVVRKSADASIVVRQNIASAEYEVGEVVVVPSTSIEGTIEHIVLLGQNSTYRIVRLYLNEVVETFAENNTVTGDDSSATGVITYTGVSVNTIPAAVRPDLVVTTTDGALVTLPYTHTTLTENTYSTKSRNCVSQLLFTYDGTITLDPPVDIWTDVTRRPEIQVNQNGTSDNWATENAWETQWGDWETVWQGTLVIETPSQIEGISNVIETTSQRQEREGISLTRTNETVTTDLGNRVVSTNLIPFMRSRVINFSGTRLKPSTEVFAFFDGIVVSDHCKLSSNSSYGTTLVTDVNGNISGQFRIPAGMFTVGTKTFVLADNETDPRDTSITTIGSASFTASGLATVEQGTILSTQVPTVSITRQTETRDIPVERQVTNMERVLPVLIFNGIDPLAQTLFVSGQPNGVLLTKIETYFRTRGEAPITLEVREVVNGYPSPSILPFSQVTLEARDVNISNDATAVTPFQFSSPVYLKNDTEYCFVLLPGGNDDGYNVWVSELGKNQIGTTERVDKQPNTGVLFVSSNNRTWTAIQSEDITFHAHIAEFEEVTGTVVLHNTPIDYLAVDTPLLPGDEVTMTSTSGVGVVKFYDEKLGIAHVQVISGEFEAGTADEGFEILSVESVLINTISPTCGVLDFNTTDLVWSYKLRDLAGTQMSSFVALNANGTTELLDSRSVFSNSEEEESFVLRGVLTTEASNLSPVIDLTKMACVVVANQINTNPDNEDTNFGDAGSRYITRKVVLDDGQEAEDLKVYLTANIPAGSDVLVFAKLLNDTDESSFEDRPWTQMTKAAPLSTVGYREYVYSIPTGNTDTATGGLGMDGVFKYTVGTLYEGYKVFAVKIVFSGEANAVPVVRDLRAIALQA